MSVKAVSNLELKQTKGKANVVKKITTLGILYFVQGLPYGFQDKFIPTHLRTSGLSHTKLSMMKLLLLPWLCKPAFAPLLDVFWTKWFWLLCSLCSLSVVALSGSIISSEDFLSVSIWLFLLNLLSAVQDIAVDGLALKILRDSEIGHGNTAQVLGYKLGALSGGGILFWINVYYGWTGLCFSLFILYVMSVLAILPLYDDQDIISNNESEPVIFVKEQKEPDSPVIEEKLGSELRLRRKHSKVMEPQVMEKISAAEFFNLFTTLFQTKGTVPLMFFLLIYKLGERGALSTFPLYMIDQGVSIKQLSIWSGIIGQTCSLLGSVSSGWLISRERKIILLLFYICLARTAPIFLQWLIICLWNPDATGLIHYIFVFFSVTSLITLEFFAGMATTAIFSLMMSCSLRAPDVIQGTHYSALSSVEVAGKLIFSSFIGALIDWLGLQHIYLALTFLSLTTVGILPLLL